jgi:thioredoxin-dependent peroxiredoxin
MADHPQVGDMAPDFEAMTDTGEKVRLSDYRGKRVIVYFYPADDTPGCTKQSCDFRDSYPAIQEKNGIVLGISPDSAESHRKFKSKYDLPFTLLVDEDHTIAEKYGAWGEKTTFGKTYTGIIRSHYVIDESGKIVDAHVGVKADQSSDIAMKALV